MGLEKEKVYNVTHFMLEYSLTAPWQNATVWNNTFSSNEANVVLAASQTQKQASSVFLEGGRRNYFLENRFLAHRGSQDAWAKAHAEALWEFLPENYFDYAMAPVVRIEYPQVENVTVGEDPGYTSVFEANVFSDNKNYQVVALGEDMQYGGALVEFESELVQAELNLTGNTARYNTFMGPGGGLVFVNGGHVSA